MLATTQTQKLIASYLTQQYRFGPKTIAATNEPDPTIPEGFIISAWSPNGKELTINQNEELSWQLQLQLRQENITHRKLITVEATRAWVEDSFFIQNISLKQAKKIAKDYSQFAFVQIKNGQAIVHLTQTREAHKTNIGYTSTQYGCPAKKLGKDSDEHCTQHGYWTTGAALSALASWRDSLTIVTSRLGCNICNNVKTHPNLFVQARQPEAFKQVRVVNRLSLAQWVRV